MHSRILFPDGHLAGRKRDRIGGQRCFERALIIIFEDDIIIEEGMVEDGTGGTTGGAADGGAAFLLAAMCTNLFMLLIQLRVT